MACKPCQKTAQRLAEARNNSKKSSNNTNFNFLDAALEVLSGNPDYASKEEKANRLSICYGCDRLEKLLGWDKEGEEKVSLCGECGCSVEIKTSFANSSCEINKWGKENNA